MNRFPDPPDLEKTWHDESFEAGRKARRDEKTLAENPIPKESRWCWQSWHAGWCDQDMALIAESEEG